MSAVNSESLKVRKDVVQSLYPEVRWESDTLGFLSCPGKTLHTTNNGEKDCRVTLDQVPTLHCFHSSCHESISVANFALRSVIGKLERARLNGELPKLGNISNLNIERGGTFDFKKWMVQNCPFEISEDDLLAATPEHSHFKESAIPHWKIFLESIFTPHEIVCIQAFSNDPPPQPAMKVEDWLKQEKPKGQFFCVNPLKSAEGVLKKTGNNEGYFSTRCLANIAERRHIVIEFDHHDLATQLKIHGWLSTKLPLLALVHSGKRSVHGIFYILGMPEDQVKKLYLLLSKLGVDRACVDASRLTRLPGILRHDKDKTGKIQAVAEQRLLYLDRTALTTFTSGKDGLKKLTQERTTK